jgi:D-cysteine desulfhydrase
VKAGCTVYTADSLRPTLGNFSAFVTADLPLPSVRENRQRYSETLARYVSHYKIDWVIPTCEETLHIAHPDCRRRIEEAGAKILLSPQDTLIRVHSKHEFARIAALNGLNVPETRRLTTVHDWGLLDYYRDAVLKREYSRFGVGLTRLHGTWNERHAQAMAALEKEGAEGWVWQEWIPGKPVSSYSVCLNGVVHCHIAYTTPYRTSENGAGTFYESHPIPEMFTAACRIAEVTGYTGQLGIDAILDVETGQVYLVECNPRATMGLALLADLDDFASAWHGILSDQPLPYVVPNETRGRVTQAKLATLLFGWKYRDADRSLHRWFRDTLRVPDALSSAEHQFDIAQLVTFANYAYQAQERGMSVLEFSTHDIAWDGSPAPSDVIAHRAEPPLPLRRPALFTAFPELEDHLPWSPLLIPTATPVEPLALSDITDTDGSFWVKRDDLTDPRYGGNKARKFEWILGEMLAKEKQRLITFGTLCSNHCTAATIYGQAAGVEVELHFIESPIDREERDLLYLQALLGAKQFLIQASTIPALLSDLSPADKGYLVPPGGSSGAGILGYVDAGLELANQIRCGEMPSPDLIYLATASRGTATGLAMGLHLAGLSPIPRLVLVDTVAPLWQKSRFLLTGAYRRTYDRLQHLLPESHYLLPAFGSLLPHTYTRYADVPMGTNHPDVVAALREAENLPNLHLDRHYSGKAFAALLADARAGGLTGKTVLFWQTHGHAPAHLVRTAFDHATSGQLTFSPDILHAIRRNLQED